MGNCVFGGFALVDPVIKVATPSGGLMELDPPITVDCITNEFPGHGIFRSSDVFGGQPLLHNEELLVGELYYLLPLLPKEDGFGINRVLTAAAPYRMSNFDNHGIWRRVETEVFSRCHKAGIWKVKLAISAEKLAEILSQEARTEALIENVRAVAKCGSGSCSSSLSSDQWSLASSSRKGSLEHIA